MRRSRAPVVVACTGCLALAACFSFGDLEGGNDNAAPGDDASTSDVSSDAPSSPAADAGDADAYVYIPPQDGSCAFETPFGAPVPLVGLNSSSDDWSPRLTADELTLFFASARTPHGDGGAGLFKAERDASTMDFGNVSLLAGVNSTATTVHPTATGNGLDLYFQSSASGKNDIFISTRANTASNFGAPSSLSINSATMEDDSPYVLPDHSALYFSRFDTSVKSVHKIMRAAGGGTADSFDLPAFEDELNSPKFDATFPTVTPDELTIFFASNDPAGAGDYDVYKAERASATDPFVNVTRVAELATPKGDYPTWISPDGCELYLMSNGAFDGGGAGGLDMYVAKRSK